MCSPAGLVAVHWYMPVSEIFRLRITKLPLAARVYLSRGEEGAGLLAAAVHSFIENSSHLFIVYT